MPVFSPDRLNVTAADMAACRSLLRDGSRTFLAASHLLPMRVRDPATALYAFCRLADDAVDLDGVSTVALRDRLDRIYAGRPAAIPADRALCAVVSRFALPRTLLDALIEGFEWDAQDRRYQTLADLHAYAARVAGTVGAMMALLMDRRDPATLAAACDLGMAMQFTNIARDVGEDARAGRLYLPTGWFAEAGLDADAWLESPTFGPAVGMMVQRLLHEADRLYRRAETGIAVLPADCRCGIYAARLLYGEIGTEVARAAYDSFSRRVRVAAPRKAVLVARALMAKRWPAALVEQAPSAATRMLVDAVQSISPPVVMPALAPRLRNTPASTRFVWLIGLFARLEQADRLKHARRLDVIR